MFIEPVPSEYVYNISDEEKCQMLKNHFNGFFASYCERNFEPNSGAEKIGELQQYVSGIPHAFLNAILGNGGSDTDIEKRIEFFNEIKLPFVWYVDEGSNPEFTTKLTGRGFQDVGIFRGVIGPLDKPLAEPELPRGTVIELVRDEAAMEEFNDLVCSVFGMMGESKELYKKALWNLAKEEPPAFYHWIARKEGKVVSAVTTYIDGNIVSFWNGASLLEVRRQGLSTAIRVTALKEAMSKGCRFGISYLMSEGLAYGICSKLGYETKWQFRAFVSPAQ